MKARDYFLNEALCPLPWIGVFVNPDGAVSNCAISQDVLGNIHKDSLEDILHSKHNQQIKKDMLACHKHDRCNVCYRTDQLSSNPNLGESNRNWYKPIGSKAVDLSFYDKPENFQLKVLDLRWRNTCNLACVYCGPDLSSRWASEMNDSRFRIEKPVLEKNKQYIFDRLEQVEHVYLAGGEPMLMKENHELLEKLLAVNPDVEIRVNTNLLAVDNKIFQLLEQFKNVKWTISVDTVGSQFEYIRWPGKWNEFAENLSYIQNKGYDINFNMVWFTFNAFSIFECIDYLLDQGFHENTFIVQCLNDPEELDIRNHLCYTKDNIKTEIAKRLESTDKSFWLNRSLNSMLNYIQQPFNGNPELVHSELHRFDKMRNLDSRTAFPELYKIND